jgi:hypothetical protein
METMFADMSGFKQFDVNLYAVEENYLNVTDTKFYMPNEIEQALIDEAGDKITKLPSGNINAIDAIFSNLTLTNLGNKSDPHEITVYNYPSKIDY